MAELLPCPFCGGEAKAEKDFLGTWKIKCTKCSCDVGRYWFWTKQHAIEAWNTRTPKEKGADKQKITCLNCKHLMFSDCYGECNKQLRIVNPSDTCEYAEPKERGGEK